jgi:hypothetical protein
MTKTCQADSYALLTTSDNNKGRTKTQKNNHTNKNYVACICFVLLYLQKTHNIRSLAYKAPYGGPQNITPVCKQQQKSMCAR